MSIEFASVSFAYQQQQPVLKDLSLELSDGERVLIVGPNGAGKSTFLKLLNGLLKPTSGSIQVNGKDTRHTTTAELAGHVSVTFQHPGDQIFASNVKGELAFAPTNLKRNNSDQLIANAAHLFGLETLLDKHPYDLPQASRKLLTVASAVASDAPVLAFDEPSAGLSYSERLTLQEALQTMINKTLIIVSHDFDLFLPLCNRVLVLSLGMLMFDGAPTRFIDKAPTFRQAGVQLPLAMRLRSILERLPHS